MARREEDVFCCATLRVSLTPATARARGLPDKSALVPRRAEGGEGEPPERFLFEDSDFVNALVVDMIMGDGTGAVGVDGEGRKVRDTVLYMLESYGRATEFGKNVPSKLRAHMEAFGRGVRLLQDVLVLYLVQVVHMPENYGQRGETAGAMKGLLVEQLSSPAMAASSVMDHIIAKITEEEDGGGADISLEEFFKPMFALIRARAEAAQLSKRPFPETVAAMDGLINVLMILLRKKPLCRMLVSSNLWLGQAREASRAHRASHATGGAGAGAGGAALAAALAAATGTATGGPAGAGAGENENANEEAGGEEEKEEAEARSPPRKKAAPAKVRLTGAALDEHSFLGTFFRPHVTRRDYDTNYESSQDNEMPNMLDLLRGGAAAGAGAGGGPGGLPGAMPSDPLRLATGSGEGNLVDTVASWMCGEPEQHADVRRLVDTTRNMVGLFETYTGRLLELFKLMLKEPTSREAALEWVAAVVMGNWDRTKSAFHHGMGDLPTSSEGLLANTLAVMLSLCGPFTLTPMDDKARGIAQKIEMDYFLSRRCRLDLSEEQKMAVASGADYWVDQRNLARQKQFASLTGGLQTETSADAEDEDARRKFGSTTEFFALAAALVNVGAAQAIVLYYETDRELRDIARERSRLQEILDGHAQTAAGMQRPMPPQLTMAARRIQIHLRKAVWRRLQLQAMLLAPFFMDNLMHFARLQSFLTLKTALFPLILGDGYLAKTRLATAGKGDPLATRMTPDEKRTWLASVSQAETFLLNPESFLPDGTPLQLPLQSVPDAAFAHLPEYLVADVADILCFYARVAHRHPQTQNNAVVNSLDMPELQSLMTFSTAFLGSARYIRNPYLRAKLVDMLSVVLPPPRNAGAGGTDPTSTVLQGHELSRNFLGPLLLQFFVDIEFTGSHTQFYDKFRYRSATADLLDLLWGNPAYRNSIVQYSIDDPLPPPALSTSTEAGSGSSSSSSSSSGGGVGGGEERKASDTDAPAGEVVVDGATETAIGGFTRFVNMLLNDTLYHMDESLKKLEELRGLMERQRRGEAEGWSDQERMENQNTQDGVSQMVKGSLREANAMTHMLMYMSEHIVEPFMAPAMRDRVASMLGYVLDYLVGQKSLQLKVEREKMSEVEFKPHQVLRNLIVIYVHFSRHGEEFARAVAADERSYRPELFERAAGVIVRPQVAGNIAQDDANSSSHIKLDWDLGELARQFRVFGEQVKTCSDAVKEQEDILAQTDIPDRFLDHITYDLMKDPVRLPTSGEVVDRAVITRVLLSDEHDPFNRAKLTADMLEPLPELKQEIQDWMDEQRHNAIAGRIAKAEAVAASTADGGNKAGDDHDNDAAGPAAWAAEAAAPPAPPTAEQERQQEQDLGTEQEEDEDDELQMAMMLSLKEAEGGGSA